ncbi:MAG: hypothetical protein HY699_14405 [Deltaproteobacteria bacterium]|nr:hypothetical protein [Deltaproteobacteria bacterium]
MKRRTWMLLAALVAACEQSPPPAPTTAVAPAPAQSPPPAAAPAPPQPAPEALPREVAGIVLGAGLAEVRTKLGALACRDNPQGFSVCTPKTPPAEAPNKLEVYLFHERVVSLAYDREVGANVWDFLNDLNTRYGPPSLNGQRETDKQGRTHEIYGWKDQQSIHSVRFVWQGEEATRQLSTTTITLWDRQGYHDWESERQAGKPPTPSGKPT